MCFLSHVPPDTQADILSSLGFQLGSFPAKFLGVPLITSKLSLADCQPLLEKLKSRISSWTNRFLSYAGRLQLIKSVIHSIQAYWSAHFILPASAIIDMNSSMSRFLWKGPSMGKSGAKVAWSKICLPYAEGGLAIKNLEDWNKAQILSHLWQIIYPASSSFWAKWVRVVHLKNKYFWIMPIPLDCSWIWRKVLKLRPIACRYISFTIGNGAHTSLWFDPWLGHSPLASSIQSPLIMNSGLGPAASVSQIIFNSNWVLPASNHNDLIEFRNAFDMASPCNSDAQDSILWDGIKAKDIKTSSFWHSIRKVGLNVGWSKMVWHNIVHPRYSFLLWLAFNKGLRTIDKLLLFGTEVNPLCVLCSSEKETFQYLFFQCRFSFQLLVAILRRCGWRGMDRSWTSITEFLCCRSGPSLKQGLLIFGFATVVYRIWQERNSRIFSNKATPLRVILRDLILVLKCRLHTYARFQKLKSLAWFHHLVL